MAGQEYLPFVMFHEGYFNIFGEEAKVIRIS